MKILYIQLGRIGDMILGTPVFGAIKSKYPNAEIHILTSTINHHIIDNNPNIDKVLIYDKKPYYSFPLFFKLIFSDYDYLIDPKDHFSYESNIFALLTRAKKKIGFISEPKKFINPYDTAVIPSNKGIHFTQICMQSLISLGIGTPSSSNSDNHNEIPKPILFPSDASITYVNEFIENNKLNKFTVINISASQRQKMWANSKWQIVIETLLAQGKQIVLSFGPSERDLADELANNIPNLIVFNSRSLNDVIALISKAENIISVDTAIVHIAAAFDKPIVVLIKKLSDNLNKFAPLSTRQELVITKRDFSKIGVDDVLEAYQRLVDI